MEKPRIYIVIAFFTSILFMFIGIFAEIDSLFWIFFLIMIVCIAGLLFYNSDTKQKIVNKFIKETESFVIDNQIHVSKSIYSDTHLSRLIFDHLQEKLVILKDRKEPLTISYSSLLESELMENGNTLTKTSRGNQIAGAVIGNALAGGVGAVIGGLSGNQTSTEIIKKLQIKLVTDNISSPVHSFFIKDSVNEFKKDSPIYNDLYDNAYEIHKIITLIIKKQENKLNTVM